MKFRYKKYAPGILRPVIPIEILCKGKIVPYEVLVDSGSDCNIFDAQLVDILGLNLLSGKKSKVAGITGIPAPIYVHKLNLRIGGHQTNNVEVGFMKHMVKYSYGVVGQKGDKYCAKYRRRGKRTGRTRQLTTNSSQNLIKSFASIV